MSSTLLGPEPGFRPRMDVTWEDAVKLLVAESGETFDTVGLSFRDLGKVERGVSNTPLFVNTVVFKMLLIRHRDDVLHGFDKDGLSFIGWIGCWDWRTGHAERLWLEASVRVPGTPRVFTTHDHAHWRRKTWTLENVLEDYSRKDFEEHIALAIKAGVSFGAPDGPVRFDHWLYAFETEDVTGRVPKNSEPLLRRIMTLVLTMHPTQLHWAHVNFRETVFEKEHVWAVPTLRWFQGQLDVKQALHAASGDFE